MTQKLLLDQR